MNISECFVVVRCLPWAIVFFSLLNRFLDGNYIYPDLHIGAYVSTFFLSNTNTYSYVPLSASEVDVLYSNGKENVNNVIGWLVERKVKEFVKKKNKNTARNIPYTVKIRIVQTTQSKPLTITYFESFLHL